MMKCFGDFVDDYNFKSTDRIRKPNIESRELETMQMPVVLRAETVCWNMKYQWGDK